MMKLNGYSSTGIVSFHTMESRLKNSKTKLVLCTRVTRNIKKIRVLRETEENSRK
jgi:hypothetical protein